MAPSGEESRETQGRCKYSEALCPQEGKERAYYPERRTGVAIEESTQDFNSADAVYQVPHETKG